MVITTETVYLRSWELTDSWLIIRNLHETKLGQIYVGTSCEAGLVCVLFLERDRMTLPSLRKSFNRRWLMVQMFGSLLFCLEALLNTGRYDAGEETESSTSRSAGRMKRFWSTRPALGFWDHKPHFLVIYFAQKSPTYCNNANFIIVPSPIVKFSHIYL